MRGIKVTTRTSGRTFCMCQKCYEKDIDEIELAIEFDLIHKPVVVNIDQCEVHCQEKKE